MVYIACFLASALMAYVASRSKDRTMIILCSVLCILIPCVLGGLRDHGIGTDTITYGYPNCRVALRAKDFLSFLVATKQEIGYGALCYSIMKTLGHQNWCYFAYQLLTVSCVYIGLYRHKEKISLPFALLIWFFIFYNQTYNIMRQTMAASIVFMGFSSLESRRYSKFMLYVFVAFLFHKSALLALPLVMGMYIVITSEAVRKNAWLKLLTFYGSICFLFLVRNIFFMVIRSIPLLSKYIYYFESKYNEVKITVVMLAIMLGEFLIMTLYSKGASRVLSGEGANRNDAEFYRFNVLFCLVFQVAVRFFTERILLYSELINVMLLAALPCFVREKNLRFIVRVGVLFATAFYWYWVFVKGKSSETWPYRSIL